MGSPISAVVAWNFFEELALESAPSKPGLWKWYMDDTCCIPKKGDADRLLHLLNSIRLTIKFTMEVGLSPSRVTRKEDGKLDITVYHIQTHMNGTCTFGLTIQHMGSGVWVVLLNHH